jgi:hypothetical protein
VQSDNEMRHLRKSYPKRKRRHKAGEVLEFCVPYATFGASTTGAAGVAGVVGVAGTSGTATGVAGFVSSVIGDMFVLIKTAFLRASMHGITTSAENHRGTFAER